MSYYSLYIPASTTGSNSAGGASITDDASKVFSDKGAALSVLKRYKDARLREFQNQDDAINYTQTGCEVVQTKYTDTKVSTAALEKAVFRAPTKQDLVRFRKDIEAGNCEAVRAQIWENPRYLVSSGDTPTCLKEGYRYNAMHVCAIANQHKIAELILQTVADPKFTDLLTGSKGDMEMCKELSANLLDYYLNLPEKGRSETPLHLASKLGAWNVVQVLTSYPECKMTRNSEGRLPMEIVGQRCQQGYTPQCDKISAALKEDRFYVPVLRSASNEVAPQIGQPFSVKQPPNLNSDPLSPEVKIQAIAGPMTKHEALQFRRRWKTPPRLGSNMSSSIVNSPFMSPQRSGQSPAALAMRSGAGATPAAEGNASPRKTPSSVWNSFFSPKSTHTAPRVLFQSTPEKVVTGRASGDDSAAAKENFIDAVTTIEDCADEEEEVAEAQMSDAACVEAPPLTTVNGQCTLLIDKQNGNHKDDAIIADVLVATTTTTTTTITHGENIAEPNNNINNNNNNNLHRHHGDYVDSVEKKPAVEGAPVKTNAEVMDTLPAQTAPNRGFGGGGANYHATSSSKDMLKSALCPRTPLWGMKKELFSTYREQYALSPVVYDTLMSSGDSMSGSGLGAAGNSSFYYDEDRPDMVDACTTPSYMERHLKITDAEKGLEVIGRELAKAERVEWREYWDFLDEFISIQSYEGMERLDKYFAQRKAEDEKKRKMNSATATAQRQLRFMRNEHSEALMANVCSALEKFVFREEDGATAGGKAKLAGSGAAGAPTMPLNGTDSKKGLTVSSEAGQSAVDGVASGGSVVGSHAHNNNAQSSPPHTCVEKSLQVFAKRMTKTIMLNMNNLVSINDTLLSELKRLKSLITSFKEDARFQLVNFAKVHSRIGNLVSIYLENSNDMNATVKKKIQTNVQNLMMAPGGERREHFDCVCTRIYEMLQHPAEQIQPENLKTEAMCAKVWAAEKDCTCQWETNLGRKSSRNNRRKHNNQSGGKPLNATKDEVAKTAVVGGGGDANAEAAKNNPFLNWRHSSGSDSTAESEDDVFWSDFGGTDTSSDDDAADIWHTPPESPSCLELMIEESRETTKEHTYNTFIFGSEPTKRDLDVLNATFHLQFLRSAYPHLHAWREAMLRYTSAQMDYFPSPSAVKSKASQLDGNTTQKSSGGGGGTGHFSNADLRRRNLMRTPSAGTPHSQSPPKTPYLSITPKRLFGTPGGGGRSSAVPTNPITDLNSSITATMNVSNTNIMADNSSGGSGSSSSHNNHNNHTNVLLQAAKLQVATPSDRAYSMQLRNFIKLADNGDYFRTTTPAEATEMPDGIDLSDCL